MNRRIVTLYSVMLGLIGLVGVLQSWALALSILNLCLFSAIMALGVNLQWGLAGQFNAGTMGSAALGGLAVVLISQAPVPEAVATAGWQLPLALLIFVGFAVLGYWVWRTSPPRIRLWTTAGSAIAGLLLFRLVFDPVVSDIESVNPAATGYLGGLGWPVLISWGVGGLFAAAAAWGIGKISLGLRADYLAIATLGISEIIIYILKNEDWLTRGVKNVTGLNRPVPYEVDLQTSEHLLELAEVSSFSVVELSILTVQLAYAGLFAVVLLIILTLIECGLRSPWGRMMRAIRDNHIAAEAMGKDVKARQLQVFVLGSAIIGIAGAMLVTLEGQFTPTSYSPLRFTFLIGVMAIVGGSGNSYGSILGGFLIWFLWIEVEPASRWLMDNLTILMEDDSTLRAHLLESVAHMRYLTMGIILLVVLKFAPHGLIPERRGDNG